jgi:hypothetical protein
VVSYLRLRTTNHPVFASTDSIDGASSTTTTDSHPFPTALIKRLVQKRIFLIMYQTLTKLAGGSLIISIGWRIENEFSG